MRTLVSRLAVGGFAASGSIVFLAAQVPTFSLVVHVHDDTLRSPNSLDSDDVATLKTWRFEPARKDGQAVPAQIIVTMSFNVK